MGVRLDSENPEKGNIKSVDLSLKCCMSCLLILIIDIAPPPEEFFYPACLKIFVVKVNL